MNLLGEKQIKITERGNKSCGRNSTENPNEEKKAGNDEQTKQSVPEGKKEEKKRQGCNNDGYGQFRNGLTCERKELLVKKVKDEQKECEQSNIDVVTANDSGRFIYCEGKGPSIWRLVRLEKQKLKSTSNRQFMRSIDVEKNFTENVNTNIEETQEWESEETESIEYCENEADNLGEIPEWQLDNIANPDRFQIGNYVMVVMLSSC